MGFADEFKAYVKELLGREEDKKPAPGENRAVPYPRHPVEDEDALFGPYDAALVSRPGLHGISSVAVRENGCIELFAGKSCGIRIDPNGRIVLLADEIVLAASSLDISTSPEGITWNGEVPFQKTMLRGFTDAGVPVTVFAHSLNEPLTKIAKGIVVMGAANKIAKSVEEWFAEVLGR